MSYDSTFVEITPENIADHPQVICFINPKQASYHHKVNWFKGQFKIGLKLKLLYLSGEKKPVGFIEYIPGEYCWRSVDAAGYMFIHCLWINGKKYQQLGLGTVLLNEVEMDARDLMGVAVLASDKAFMATKAIFLKNGYEIVAQSGKDQLLAKKFVAGPGPAINDWENQLHKYQGLNIVYTKQCPWVARFVDEVQPVLREMNLSATITELSTAQEVQRAPSLYASFSLIYNGKLLADRYISLTRFKNIVNKELMPLLNQTQQ